MERYTMFLDWKNQYCSNDHIIQGNLQIQCSLYQNTNGISTKQEQIILNLYENTKTPNSQNNLEKEQI